MLNNIEEKENVSIETKKEKKKEQVITNKEQNKIQNKTSEIKLYPTFKSACLVVLSAGLIIIFSSLLIMIFTILGTKDKFEFSAIDIGVIATLIGFTIIFLLVTRLRIFYFLTMNQLQVQKYTKKDVYQFKDIIYIDDIRSRKEKKLYFYLSSGKQVMLVCDSNLSLINQVIIRCPNLVSRNEFIKKFPFIDLNGFQNSKKRKK